MSNAPITHDNAPGARFLLSISLISAAALGYEILLMRLFSIIQWHHFAYMMISLALLGFGVSGTFISLTAERLIRHFSIAYNINASLFSIAAIVCFLLAQQVKFNPLEILWDLGQWLRLTEIFLLLMLPFLFAANCICLSFIQYKKHINRIYAADLFGAGLGTLGVILLLNWIFPMTILGLISGLGFCAVAMAAARPARSLIWIVIAGLIPLFVWQADISLQPVEYKQLSQTLKHIGARVIAERSGPLGLVTVVDSPKVPFRHAPGLSLLSPSLPPEQLGLFVDGEGMTAISRFDGDMHSLDYLREMPSSAPYVLLDQPDVLILGVGGGSGLLQALRYDAKQIDAVELNADVVHLLRNEFADYSGHIYDHEKIHIHIAEARGFLESTSAQYDLIQMELLDAFNVSSAGLSALNENYLYTVEAIQKAMQHLKPGGLLAIGRWIRLPPRDGPRLMATVIEALNRSGVQEAGNRLVWIRSWNLNVLLIKNGDFEAKEIDAIRAFCQTRAFDLTWVPGIRENEVNRYNRLAEPSFYQAAVALLGDEKASYIANNKFNITAVTDDKPYFFRFFRWRILPDVFNNLKTGGYSLLDLGYLVLIATLLLAVIFSFLLIILPLLFSRHARSGNSHSQSRTRVALYFACLGFAFMFIEIAFMQRFSLYLAHPVISAATVLTSFLIFAGIGSQQIGLGRHPYGKKRVIFAVTGITLITFLYLLILSALFSESIALPDVIKILITVLLIAPLAFFMGMPFPAGLARLDSGRDDQTGSMVSWAWCINGCASVIGAVFSTLLATHYGISAVILMGLVIYLLSLLFLPVSAGEMR